ncbi:MAG TPA: CRTAC1 family protein [Abditibacteriaceae bacterium]|jgi:hypothetical protein
MNDFSSLEIWVKKFSFLDFMLNRGEVGTVFPKVFLFASMTLIVIGGCQNDALEKKVLELETEIVHNPPVPKQVAQFVDATGSSGLKFRHRNGFSELMLMPESLGSGAAWFDYDGDGDQDVFLVNGRHWTPGEVRSAKSASRAAQQKVFSQQKGTRIRNSSAARVESREFAKKRATGTLFRNEKGKFRDVTSGSGLDVEMQGMGVVAGDYDADGRIDLYLTGVGRNFLFRNLGQGRFADRSSFAGVRGENWSTSAAFLDFDRDGRLDLFVGRYVRWHPSIDPFSSDQGVRIYSPPQAYAGQHNLLFRNLGGGRFADVSRSAGLDTPNAKRNGKALGVALSDFNNDGWIDVVVANDGTPNCQFENQRNGTFKDVAQRTGLTGSPSGKPRAGMGIDTANIDDSDRESVVVGNFSGEMLALYRNDGRGVFRDIAVTSGIGGASVNYLTFGLAFIDADLDGRLDILTANGHVEPAIAQLDRGNVTYAQRPLLFRNQGAGRFLEVGQSSGKAFQRPVVARGLACADYDLDGDIDALFTTNGGAPMLLRNVGGNSNNALRVILEGTRANRSAIGATVVAQVQNRTLRQRVKSGSSYLSQSELPLTFGLERASAVKTLIVNWPRGGQTRLLNVKANQILHVREGVGVVNKSPLLSSMR